MNRDLSIIAAALFEPADIVELRFIHPRRPPKKQWTTAAELPRLYEPLEALNRQGYNVYFGVNPRRERGKSGDNNVLLARCLFVDFDNVNPGDGCGRLEFIWNDIFFAGLPEPTLAVHSGHGLHVYWRLSDPLTDLNLWRQTQEQLSRRLDADPTIKNPERIMRLPGFFNTKQRPYQNCFICWSENYAHN